MKIDLKRIIENSGEKVSQRKIAAEMVERGLFKNVHSAVAMMQYNASGKNKSINLELLNYVKERFNLTTDQALGIEK